MSKRKKQPLSSEYETIVVCVSWAEIMSCNTSYILSAFSELDDELNLNNRNKVQIVVSTPAYERRELVEIPEVRCFFQRVFNSIESAFFWLDPTKPTFWLWAFMLQKNLEVYRVGNQLLLDPGCILAYLDTGCKKLSAFCERTGAPLEPSRSLIFDTYKRNCVSGNWLR